MNQEDYITYVISLKYPETVLNTLSKHSLNPILFNGINVKLVHKILLKNIVHHYMQNLVPKVL